MELKDASITMLFNHDGLTIELHDDLAAITFAKINLTQKQVCQALSRLSHTDCSMEIVGLERIGKRHEHQSFEFKMPDGSDWHDEGAAKTECIRVCPEGWTPDLYFRSQNSFFKKGDEEWARCHIRRWVDDKEPAR